MSARLCPHGRIGPCRACASSDEARALGESIGAEAGAVLGDAIAEPIRALRAERDVLLSIVRDLADTEPLVNDLDDLYPTEVCGLCDNTIDKPDTPSEHADSCLWVRARAFLASRETPEGEPK